MPRVLASAHAGNALLLVLAVGLGLASTAITSRPPAPLSRLGGASAAVVVDASGGRVALPRGRAMRIASVSIVADAVLADLARDRAVAVSAWSPATTLPGLPRLSDLADVEAVLALRPDLVVCHRLPGDAGVVARLRDAGVAVCDLGPMRGEASTARSARWLGHLIGLSAAGEQWAGQRARSLADLHALPPPRGQRWRTVYVAPVLDVLYGGTVGTSFHDLLLAAGLEDAAADAYRDWPAYGPEDLLRLDPDLIVVPAGAEIVVRALPGLRNLRALTAPPPGCPGLVGVARSLLDNPIALIDAAAALRATLQR